MGNIYGGKGDAMTCGSYRGNKLLEPVPKVLKRGIKGWVRSVIKIDNMQFGYLAGWSTANLLFSFVSCRRNTC